jgi:integrase
LNTLRSEQSHLAVKQAQQLLKDLVTLIQKPQHSKHREDETDNKSAAVVGTLKAKELKNHHLIATSLISSKLQEPDYSSNFYVYLLGCWILDLLKNGGLRKSTLRLSTIRNYVAETSNKFLMVFSDIDFLETDAEILTEKLNKVASIMPAKACGSLYYLALFIQKLGLVQDFFASDLEIKLGAGQVNANVVSVPQFELLAEYLYSKGTQYYDAILLMCMGFYTSMRRQEAKQIRISDFELLNISGRTDITVKVVPTEERNLKSRSGTRRIHLNAFWPTKWMELLADKVKLARAYGVSKSDLLFGDDSNQLFSIVSKLLRDYLRDEGFRYQNLRHSFVCWQFYRLVLQPKIIKTKNAIPAFIDHDYFSDAACIELRKHLGLAHNTRKSIYALCSLVGHSDPQTTFGSYLHLRDLYLRMLIADTVKLDQKALSRLVSRAKLDEQFARCDFPPGAISYVSLYDQETLGINPLPDLQEMSLLSMRQITLELPFNLPSLYQIERSLAYIQTLRADDIVAVGDDKERIIVEGAWLTQLDRSCQYVQRYYPMRGRRLNLRPLIPKAKHQLRADKKISKSRVLFEDLRSCTQQALDSCKLDDASIIKGLDAFRGVLIAEELTIQFKKTADLINFLNVCKHIIPPYIKPITTVHYPENSEEQTNTSDFLNAWSQVLSEFDVELRHLAFESIAKTEYWSKHLKNGLAWLYFVRTDCEPKQRASVVMHYLHFLLIACQTRLNLNSSDTSKNKVFSSKINKRSDS